MFTVKVGEHQLVSSRWHWQYSIVAVVSSRHLGLS